MIELDLLCAEIPDSLNPYRELCPLLQDLMTRQCWSDGFLLPALHIVPLTFPQCGCPLQPASSTTALLKNRASGSTTPASTSSHQRKSFWGWGLTFCWWRVNEYGGPSASVAFEPLHWKGDWYKRDCHLCWWGSLQSVSKHKMKSYKHRNTQAHTQCNLLTPDQCKTFLCARPAKMKEPSGYHLSCLNRAGEE